MGAKSLQIHSRRAKLLTRHSMYSTIICQAWANLDDVIREILLRKQKVRNQKEYLGEQSQIVAACKAE